MNKRTILAGMIPAILLSQSAAAKAPVFDRSRPVMFVCSVSGGKYLRTTVSSEQVCTLFQRRIDTAIARSTRKAVAMPTRGDVIRISVRIAGPNEVSASARIRAKGRFTDVPELTLDIMDKSIELRDLEPLANQLARTIVQ